MLQQSISAKLYASADNLFLHKLYHTDTLPLYSSYNQFLKILIGEPRFILFF